MAWEFLRTSPLERHLLQCRFASEEAASDLAPQALLPTSAPLLLACLELKVRVLTEVQI